MRTYYIYHIKGVKIGVTNNIADRVINQQGYDSDDYEILDFSDNIDYISKRELKLQKKYGYKIDNELYKNINNKGMKVTALTTTFECNLKDLNEYLKPGEFINNTNTGSFELNKILISNIVKKSKPSMYNENECFIYNKILADLIDKPTVFNKIRKWAFEKGIYNKGDSKSQYCKLGEEVGELGRAILNKDKEETIDAIGDIVIVLTSLAHLEGLKIENCIDSAYNVISNRKGEMINGTFVKDQ